MWIRSIFSNFLYLLLKWKNVSLRIRGVKIDLSSRIYIDKTSNFRLGEGSRVLRSDIRMQNNATLNIDSNALIENSTVKIGENCQVVIGANFKLVDASLVIQHSSQVEMGNDCLVALAPPARECGIRAANGIVKMGDNGNVRGVVRVSGGKFLMGSNSFLNQESEVRCEDSVTIGDYVFISYGVDIFDTNTHSVDYRRRRQEVVDGYPNRTTPSYRSETAPVVLGDDVWIGKGAAVLKGCNIGARSIIGTRAVVTTSCPENSILIGNPAKVKPLADIANEVKRDDLDSEKE